MLNSPEIEPYAADIVDTLMDLVRVENEENAVLCMKTIMDLERHQTVATAPKVQPFLDLIQEMFQMMQQVVSDTFDNPTNPGSQNQPSQSPRPGSPTTTVSEPGAEKKDPPLLAKGMQSFKVLAECPIIVVSIFQAHRTSVSANVKRFVPLIKGILLLQAKPQERAHEEAAATHTVFTGVCKEIKNRAAFGEFITAQVKTMSFLAYLLRVYAQQLADFLPSLPGVVVRLLKDCPREKSSARKELLVAIRHIINFNYRKIFLPKIDELLDERTLIGDGLTVYETMRPLAYSMLADLIHHVRDSLNRDQIRRTVEVYTRNLHDNFPGTSFQTMSAKLLLNMAESITKLENKDDARYFLIMILDAIGDKFAAMNHQYPNAFKLSQQYEKQANDGISDSYLADKESPPDWDEVDIFTAAPIKTSNPRDRAADPVADNKFLFKNLVNGLKNMFYQLKTCNPPNLNIDSSVAPANWPEVSFGYNAEEVRVITKLFHEGARVFRYYNTETPPQEIHYNSPVEFLASHYMSQMSREEKELLESFGTVFHCIDTATFHEVFQKEIPHLHELMFEHTALLHLPQFFLASEATSPAFAGMVLQYLMDQIEEVGTAKVIKSSILLRMFKLSFMAVTLFSSQNEQVLHPHVTKIVTKCVQLSVTAEEPLNYFLLLRSLFRSIGGGRFELLYKEILPLLEMLLETFNHLLEGARKKTERDLYVELTLTVPARLSHLLPHLNHLMKPLVVALRAGSDLVGQGLRTLELCVDNLTADYLDPIMAPIMDELMTALWDHLRPNPYSHFHAHTTMRILGKLGGRNRKFLNHPPQLSYRNYSDDEPSFDVRLSGSNKDRAFPMETGIGFAISKLLEVPITPSAKASDSYYKQQSFKLLSTQVKLLIGYDHLPEDLPALLRSEANDLLANRFDISGDVIDKPEREKSVRKRRAQELTLQKLLKACIFATTIPELKSSATSFVADVCRHFTIVEVGRALLDARRKKKEFDVNAGEGPLHLDTRVLADAFVDGFSSDDVNTRVATEEAMLVVRDTANVVFGSREKAAKLPFFQHIAKIFCHNCHQAEWYTKAGAAFGIKVLATQLDLGHEWLLGKQIDFTRALMFVIKDMPEDLPASTRTSAEATLETILRQCTAGLSKDTLTNEKSRLYAICGIFVPELSHLSRHVREAAQHAISVMAEVIGAEAYELILPVKDRLIAPIFNKPLRACPPPTQIGFIDAITFCLGLGHDIVPFNEQLNRLMLESLSLVDADDESLVPRAAEFNNGELVVHLRVSCLRLLSMAMTFQEFANAPQNTSRARIIAVFFKSLYSKSPEIIEAANAGLKDVLTQTNKLPKDLLQNGLRPILMNLQDPKRLSVAGLDGLARLLTLLTNYFKVEIGARLLEHMKVIADEQTLQKVSFGLIEQNSQMKIVAAIFNIFHLLPPAAVTFMQDLVNAVLDLEAKLRRTTFSPFRKPLVKYLNRYPKESWTFFQGHMQDEKYGRFFGQILADAESEPLRRVVISETEALIKASFDVEDEERRIVASINAIFVIHAICTKNTAADWFRSHPELKQSLLSAGKDLHDRLRRDTLEPSQRLRVEQAGDQLMDIFTAYLAGAKDDADSMFEVFAAAALDEIKTPLQLFKFLYSTIIESESSDYRRAIITRCIDVYGNKATSQKVKTFLFHNVVNPIFAMDVKNMRQQHVKKSALMDKAMSDMLHNRLWKPQTGDLTEESAQLGVDHSRMEVLQLSALLIKYHKDIVSEARKDIIKFAWSYIRLDDIINKYGAYVLISYFIWSYETPSKVAMQIYVALLRAHQNEGKALVTQALEILAQVLPLRVQPAADPRYPTWARWPRRILAEETGNLQQVMSIFQFLVKQPDLFYESREYFIPLIVPSLHKIATPPNPSNESKKLALALITLICQWELKRSQAQASPSATSQNEVSTPMKRDGSGTSILPPPASRDRQEYTLPTELRTAIIKYLITFITSLQERYPVPAAEIKARVIPKAQQQSVSIDMCKNALQLLRDLLSPNLWADVDIELYQKATEPILAGEKADKPEEKHLTCMINVLQVIRIILSTKKEEWIVAHLPLLQKMLEKPLRMDNAEIQDCLHSEDDEDKRTRKIKPLLRQILDAVPEEPTAEEDAMEVDSTSSEFVTFLSTIATETLAATNLNSSINLLWTLAQVRPAEIDQHIPNVIRALSGKLAKDHLSAYSPPQGPIPPGYRPGEPNMDPYEFELGVSLIKKTIDLVAVRMSTLGEQRRPFLSLLASLVEKSLNSEVCNKILDMVAAWVFNSTESWPTLKEKTAVLHKMLLFEQRQDQNLLKRFLDLVIKIYEDPRVTRTELTVRMEHAFLIGTRANDVEMRNRFMAIFDRSLSRTTSSRLSYVLTSQNWDTLADSFWLKQASQLVMGSVETSTLARMHAEDFRICPTSLLFGSSLVSEEEMKDAAMVESDLDELAANHKRFNREIGDVRVRDIL
jgi:transformation/transcription domain-associated protein